MLRSLEIVAQAGRPLVIISWTVEDIDGEALAAFRELQVAAVKASGFGNPFWETWLSGGPRYRLHCRNLSSDGYMSKYRINFLTC